MSGVFSYTAKINHEYKSLAGIFVVIFVELKYNK